MDCPVCLALLRETNLLGQVEALLTIQDRARMFQPEDGQGAGRSSHEECRDILIVTRKRQARIASRLETHRADEHRIPA